MRGLGILLFLTLALAAGALFLLTDAKPSLDRSAVLSVEDMARGKAVIDGLGLRGIRDGESRRLRLTEGDLDRGINHLAARLMKGSASARIADDRLALSASLPVAGLPRYLNVKVSFVPAGELLTPASVRIGRVRVPPGLAWRTLLFIVARSPYAEELAAARAMLDSARLKGNGLELGFTWRGKLVELAAARVAGQGIDEHVLTVYREDLGQVRTRDFAVLLNRVFVLAQQRGGDPVMENRAALTVLAETALGSRLLSRRGVVSPRRNTGIRLAGREDFAQHFALSAFIAATGGTEVADLAGLYKELKDSRVGSGFSITDLAANRAGTRLGEAATASTAEARGVQRRLAAGADAKAYFPAVRDLPEFMPESEFKQRFGGVGAPAYQRVMADIEARIGALALYRD